MMTKIFISHSSEDSKFAQELANLLVKLRFDVWIDLSGRLWDWKLIPALQNILDECEIMIFVVSPASVVFPRDNGNWQYYLEKEKRVIPVIWRSADVPFPLQRAQYVNFQDGDFKAALALLRVELGQAGENVTEGKLHPMQIQKASVKVASSGYAMQPFTLLTQHVVELAEEFALRDGDADIVAEDFLMAMLRQEGSIANRVLSELGMEAEHVEAFVQAVKRPADHLVVSTAGLSPSCRRLLELAVDESRRMGHRYIGTEHLLLGLARVNDDIIIDILNHFMVSPIEIRRKVRRVLMETLIQDSPKSNDDQP